MTVDVFNEKALIKELDSVVERFSEQVSKINTGKIDVEAINNISVQAYDQANLLQSIAQVAVRDAITAEVTIWDKSITQDVEKALQDSNLGASVISTEGIIRLKFNPLTQADREDKVKEVKKLKEENLVKIRQVRQDFRKGFIGAEGISEDQEKAYDKRLQEFIDEYSEKIDEKCDIKEKELMSF